MHEAYKYEEDGNSKRALVKREGGVPAEKMML